MLNATAESSPTTYPNKNDIRRQTKLIMANTTATEAKIDLVSFFATTTSPWAVSTPQDGQKDELSSMIFPHLGQYIICYLSNIS